MAKIKICGLRRTEDAEYVNIARPYYCGMILSPGFKRSIDKETAERIAKSVDKEIVKVGVFVDADLSEIEEYADLGIIDAVQLHGKESEEYILRLKEKVKLPVIKAVKVKEPGDVRKAAKYPVEYILFDNGTGTGIRFDYSVFAEGLEGYDGPPFFMAGGIDSGNIGEALSFSPYGIDVSSSVETDGVKDLKKIKELTDLVRRS